MPPGYRQHWLSHLLVAAMFTRWNQHIKWDKGGLMLFTDEHDVNTVLVYVIARNIPAKGEGRTVCVTFRMLRDLEARAEHLEDSPQKVVACVITQGDHTRAFLITADDVRSLPQVKLGWSVRVGPQASGFPQYLRDLPGSSYVSLIVDDNTP
jgi:hypothetical protein